jgi:hypothetical protein
MVWIVRVRVRQRVEPAACFIPITIPTNGQAAGASREKTRREVSESSRTTGGLGLGLDFSRLGPGFRSFAYLRTMLYLVVGKPRLPAI